MQSPAKVVTLGQLAQHNSKQDLWIAVHGKVYELGSFATDHPGGVDALLECAGTDGSETYDYAGHSADAMVSLRRFVIGSLEGHVDAGLANGHPTKTGSDGDSAKSVARRAVIPAPWNILERCWAWLLVFGLVVLVRARLLQVFKAGFVVVSRFELGHSSILTGFWAGLFVALFIASVGVAVIYTQFAKTLQHTKEPFEYPAVIPRPIRTSG